ncbi:ABC transporter substrate-binding protein [Bdellovibrio reynosensis]|uniref:ABC transporter substrate-binding protein n=1 Tax=Bdellovibrio reynosensis TaxID=2835041 RepID=A0ABY4C7Z3_9BACT|nr:ABC transporter substrate-binding protein [Bdellovibrio reynosensis]UOF01047.1 ABC transporter substrate-binding protein [Bdellovibrio reynosensis]
MSVLRIPLKGLPSNFDPHNMSDTYSMIANLQLHRSLLRFSSSSDATFDIAKDFKTSKNGTEILFLLDEKRKFSDGTSITADDVVKSFQRIFKDKTTIAADLSYIVGAEENDLSVLQIKAHSTNSVLFKLRHPCSLFFKQIATVDASILKLDENLNLIPNVFSGPYQLQSFNECEVVLQRVQAVALSNAPQKIVFLKNEDVGHSFDSISRNVDRVDESFLDSQLLEEFKQAGWKDKGTGSANIFGLSMNPSRIPFLHRSIIFEYFYGKLVNLSEHNLLSAYGVVPPVVEGALQKPLYFPAETSKNNVPGTYKILCTKDSLYSQVLAPVCKKLLDEQQINLILEEKEIRDLIQLSQNEDFDIRLVPKVIDYPDAYGMLSYFRSGFEANRFFVNNRKIDGLLDDLLKASDTERHVLISAEIQKIILEEKVFIPLFARGKNAAFWSPRIKVIPDHQMGLFSLPFEMIELES